MSKTMLPLLLVLITLAYFGYNWGPQEITAAATPAQPNTLIKTYLVNTRTLSYDDRGILTQILEASRVEQYVKKKHSLMQQPRMYSHVGDNQSWSVRSNRGLYFPRREIVNLRGKVVFTNEQRQLELVTQSMKINLKDESAESKVPVTITQGRSTTTAQGMTADLKKEQILMKSNVESIYVPATP